MTIAQFIVAFAMIWWLVFFMVLPFGTKKEDGRDGVSYPAAPKIIAFKRKYVITTAISALCMVGFWWLIEESGWALY